jgi:hypothetical protein
MIDAPAIKSPRHLTKIKKADVIEHHTEFHHVGLLIDKPPELLGVSFT